MLFGLRRGVGEPAAMGCLGLYPEPSLPRKPMAGKGSLWEKWKRSSALRFGLIVQEKKVVFLEGRRERKERKERRPTHLCLGAASKDPITFMGRGRKKRRDVVV